MGQGGPCPPKFFEIVGSSQILMFHRKIFAFLLLDLNSVGQSLNLAPYSTGATIPLVLSSSSMPMDLESYSPKEDT